MKNKLLLSLLIFSIALGSCKKDNREPPSSTITGRVMYDKQALSVRSGGVELELWQYGYALRNKIPVYLNQDGSFSATVFDGNYKLTLLRGNGPWADKTDSIDVTVRGSATADVSVDPYFLVSTPNYQKSGTTITATFNLQRINTSKALEAARLYIGQTNITDQNNNAANVSKAAATITDLTQPINISANIPTALASKDYVYARVGVKIAGVAELLYSQPQMIALK